MSKTLFEISPVVLSLLLASPAMASGPFALDVQVFDDVVSCDEDGILDVGEVGRAVVVVRNLSEEAFTGVRVVVRPDAGLHADSPEVVVPELSPNGAAVAEFQVALERAEGSQVGLQVDVDVPGADDLSASVRREFIAHVDLARGEATLDDVTLAGSSWGVEQDLEYGVASGWARGLDEDGNHVWFVVGSEDGAHASLVSPLIVPAKYEPFVFSFGHRYEMGAPGEDAAAAGVIEISRDGGRSWQDVSGYADLAYDGQLEGLDAPVPEGPAFVDRSPELPARHRVELHFGSRLAGEPLRLRFRYAAAPGVRGAGWELDDFEVQGTEYAPFDAYVPHRGICSAQLSLSGGVPRATLTPPSQPQGGQTGQGGLQSAAIETPELSAVTVADVQPAVIAERGAVDALDVVPPALETTPFGRIHGGQVVATGCSSTAPGSVPFALGLFAVWLVAVRRRR